MTFHERRSKRSRGRASTSAFTKLCFHSLPIPLPLYVFFLFIFTQISFAEVTLTREAESPFAFWNFSFLALSRSALFRTRMKAIWNLNISLVTEERESFEIRTETFSFETRIFLLFIVRSKILLLPAARNLNKTILFYISPKVVFATDVAFCVLFDLRRGRSKENSIPNVGISSWQSRL